MNRIHVGGLPNGRYLSIIQGHGAYGNREDQLVEVAVMSADGRILGGDVHAHLNALQLRDLLDRCLNGAVE